jgi:8-oxo-dGTP pyrophosphatase MutT (NUDIX family)
MPFPVSIKGVLMDGDRVVLLENERREWELPGGRLEPGEAPLIISHEHNRMGAISLRSTIWRCQRGIGGQSAIRLIN